ncbi:VOC family protein [Pseudoalteromonas sp. SR44-5]|uniref:VOC family protein n=1 Tax=unclassified Pseudoalteromonas TaxID=194690 RepID=UPI0016021F6C|nr:MULTISPECIES: VOC family protein [unclassified Pseudoalteromonas]MBB1333681.1 VOC family protein [Pseudoalteromonas sp. SR41-6]MBB1341593.1 VOC family protein [Pseudoalteromonas sp. SR45-6]MBB1366859.1 VOC family protein [Pseudoalteromonas sp. SR44-5]MBB1420110.1 VOC family protein [Pseudoalteromonas sp. SG44-1]MBB1424564.1 VOC family protein [Pseudoalteromonas sp. SG43-7]
MNLNQITLPVCDIEKANQFYLAMGFTQIVKTDHYSRFECPNKATFSLLLTDDVFSNGAVIYFESAELEKWVASLKAKGFEFESVITVQRYLWREAVLKDPSGNKIKLYWAGCNRLNPSWRVEVTD